MGNQNKRQTSITSIHFQSVKNLPIPLSYSQCVLHKHEILVCGGYYQRGCYSYHTRKNKYKFICEYPSDVVLWGHCVVDLIDNNSKDSNEITLLSFGGWTKHTLVMKYVSVWSNSSEINKSQKLKESNNYNKWAPFTDNHNNPIHIGRNGDHYSGVRAVIGGSNNHLLFITYLKDNISVFDLNTFQFIKHDTLPDHNYIYLHCFVSRSKKGQEIRKTNEEKNKNNNEMLLFCWKTGLSIKYDEDNNNFQFRQLLVCDDIAPFNDYAYVYINDVILIFGGWNYSNTSKLVHKYSIQENTWTTFEYISPFPLRNCSGILNKDNTHIHIIGGINDKNMSLPTHIKTKVAIWSDNSHSVIFILIYLFFVIKYKQILSQRTN
ncbi:hypothetical protein RFI_37011 [Reticulomyxa filosa]|uniref:Kelch motif family protein n=1 Tax=Reticulomyxa filosa TaxID=46433 RepID=X6LGG1_RETFI|nr:hypothetical protein RFI_37011 [Reticulomyxa filosa]|eukprot:ETO00431.1 hypothetical protein RFI_37011 [Reticulomyxa filosa]